MLDPFSTTTATSTRVAATVRGIRTAAICNPPRIGELLAARGINR